VVGEVKRFGVIVLVGLGAAALGYFFSPDCPAPVGVNPPQTCEEKMAAAEDLAGRLRNMEALVDSCEAAPK